MNSVISMKYNFWALEIPEEQEKSMYPAKAVSIRNSRGSPALLMYVES